MRTKIIYQILLPPFFFFSPFCFCFFFMQKGGFIKAQYRTNGQRELSLLLFSILKSTANNVWVYRIYNTLFIKKKKIFNWEILLKCPMMNPSICHPKVDVNFSN